MGQHGGEVDDAGRLVDRGGLHRGDFMLPKVLRTMSRPLDNGAYRNARSDPPGPSRMVPTNDFSGLLSSIWALAKAAARLAIDSLDRCMAFLRLNEVETHCARF